ncbi:MAG: sulfotransferase [Candidatus Eremiobacteraeota bacterium]|nr:sulfotransferase [Candidatus Eremiobacteraeota bacterium]
MKIFMIGTQRSGSNLFRLMLNQLPEIAAPHPPHILIRLMPLVPTYGDLADPESFRLLVDDACRLVETNPVEWEGVKLDRVDIEGRCDRRDLYAVMAAIYDVLREVWGKSSWCCKSLGNVKYASELADRFPDAKFIYLYRDGRDVALSFTKAIEGEKNYYHIAKVWDADQQLALRLLDRIGQQRELAISYEALTQDELGTMRNVCDFLGATYSESAMDFYRTEEAKKAATASNLWENVTKPVMKDNTRKFLTQTKKEDLQIFESVAGRSLDELGYERVALKKGEELEFAPDQIASFTEDNERLKKLAWENLDPEDRRRRAEQRAVLDEIAARNARRAEAVAVS